MPLGTPIGLNEQIKQNALNDTDWRHHDDVEWLYAMGDLLNEHFFEGNIPQVVIGLDETGRLKKSGEFHFEGDGVSLKNHIDLKKGLTKLEQALALVHNYVHAETSVYGTPKTWYHSAAFRKRLKDFGLKANKSGDLTAIDVDTFTTVLEKLHALGLTAELETMVVGPDPEPAKPDLIEPEVKVNGASTPLVEINAQDLWNQAHGVEAADPETPAVLASQNFMGGPGGAPASFAAWNEAKATIEAQHPSITPTATDLGEMAQNGPQIPTEGICPDCGHLYGGHAYGTESGEPPFCVDGDCACAMPTLMAYTPVAPVADKPKAKKKTAMIKWSCGCTNIRCAVKLEAQCLKCGNQFVITDKNVVGTEA